MQSQGKMIDAWQSILYCMRRRADAPAYRSFFRQQETKNIRNHHGATSHYFVPFSGDPPFEGS